MDDGHIRIVVLPTHWASRMRCLNYGNHPQTKNVYLESSLVDDVKCVCFTRTNHRRHPSHLVLLLISGVMCCKYSIFLCWGNWRHPKQYAKHLLGNGRITIILPVAVGWHKKKSKLMMKHFDTIWSPFLVYLDYSDTISPSKPLQGTFLLDSTQ